MRLINRTTLQLEEFNGETIPPYAILSHIWSTDEVTFRDMGNPICKSKAGFQKIELVAKQAMMEGLDYFWTDSCCINTTSSSELTEAIYSRFQWLADCVVCFVYLDDVSQGSSSQNQQRQFRASRWFTSGSTLQELLAPASIKFFTSDWHLIGDKKTMERLIHEITGIPISALQGASLSDFSVDERLSWAKTRKNLRSEDRAYSMLGLFDVSLPFLYGERGEKAMKRLMRAIEANLDLPDPSSVSKDYQPLEQSQFRDPISKRTLQKEYEPLKQSQFRVLVLSPGAHGSDITGNIEVFDLLDPPHYNAVSYTWGHEPAIHRIDINQTPTFIRPNLFQALQRMRSHKQHVYLWVDSLCINQSDIEERTCQVRRMADIYRKAKNVWIWLGEEDLTSKVAMNLIPKLLGYSSGQRNDRWGYRWYHEFIALEQLLERSWFTRRWVIQEAAFSARSVIFCGADQIDMDDFVAAVDMIRQQLERKPGLEPKPRRDRGVLSVSQAPPIVIPSLSTGTLSGFQDSPAVRFLDIMKNVFHRSDHGTQLIPRLPLETLVDLSTMCDASDQRDTIFALLNLANDTGPSGEIAMQPLLTPDYSRSLLDIYSQFITHCCHKSGSLDIICRPWAPVQRPWSPMTMGTAQQQQRETLPSWIATRDRLPYGTTSRASGHRLNGQPLVGGSQKRIYNAHWTTKPDINFGIVAQTDTRNRPLFAKGIILGSINTISARMAEAMITKECLSLLHEASDKSFSGADLLEAVWSILCANRDENGCPPPSWYRESARNLIKFSPLSQISSDSSLSSIDVQDVLETSTVMSKRDEIYLNRIRDVLWNRRTFRGTINYLGPTNKIFVGLAPRHGRFGDKICILYGCSVPVVLREHSGAGPGSPPYWRLIGEAYAHGFMDGEANLLKLKEKAFEIR
jgi:hypothetical protein